jgi:hypothetical protein
LAAVTGRAKTPLQPAPATYSQRAQQELQNELDRRDDQTHKREAHIECRRGTGVILSDTVTGTRYLLQITSGAVALTAL